MSVAPSTSNENRDLSDSGERESCDRARITTRAPSHGGNNSAFPLPGCEPGQRPSLGPMSGIRAKPSVLIVEDSPTTLRVYAGALTRRGYDVTTATSVEEGRAAIAARMPDVVLLDVFLPRISGFELLSELRSEPRTHSIPVILISGLSDKEHVIEGLGLGANDYVSKPIVMPILVARMEALLRTSALVRKLEIQAEMLAKLAAYDELTGLYNRRAFFHALETEITRTRRYQHSIGVLMIDVDHFKSINDKLGHAAGDSVLRQLALRLRECLRVMDAVGRYGGEEFCVVLPETNLVGAIRAGERVRKMISDTPFETGSGPLGVSVSIGVASFGPGPSRVIPDLIAQADFALLEAKRSGRNCVVAHELPASRP